MATPAKTTGVTGIVAIGRNEGERLRVCLTSAKKQTEYVVYVDSDSTDDSLSIAEELDVDIVRLDMSIPFSAARARNEGFNRIITLFPEIKYVQFVDGDCEIVFDWINKSVDFLATHSDYAAVCGRREERYPESSVFNRLCDIEWDTPLGEAKTCGGDALFNVAAFTQVGGFNPNVIAGEEPELCYRLRQGGWKIWRLDAKMTLHDANITKFSQWWKRSLRAGHAYAQNAYLHGGSEERHRVRDSVRIWIWALVLPVGALFSILLHKGFLLLLLLYPLQIVRLALKSKLTSWKLRWQHAFFLVLGKFPEFLGQIKFFITTLSGSSSTIIEYKS